jgi:hypothetical protein
VDVERPSHWTTFLETINLRKRLVTPTPSHRRLVTSYAEGVTFLSPGLFAQRTTLGNESNEFAYAESVTHPANQIRANTMAKAPKKITKKTTTAKASNPRKTTSKPTTKSSARKPTKPKLLSGGNPQIAKGDGDAPVQTYIAAMPGWKQNIGHRLDTLITHTVSDVQKAVKWNTPFYGLKEPEEKPAWFLAFHCTTNYIKIAFFRGTSLRPIPPTESKQKEVRYFHIHEDDELDETQFIRWIKQASKLPGQRM